MNLEWGTQKVSPSIRVGGSGRDLGKDPREQVQCSVLAVERTDFQEGRANNAKCSRVPIQSELDGVRQTWQGCRWGERGRVATGKCEKKETV